VTAVKDVLLHMQVLQVQVRPRPLLGLRLRPLRLCLRQRLLLGRLRQLRLRPLRLCLRQRLLLGRLRQQVQVKVQPW
jgi:hypothetical protein